MQRMAHHTDATIAVTLAIMGWRWVPLAIDVWKLEDESGRRLDGVYQLVGSRYWCRSGNPMDRFTSLAKAQRAVERDILLGLR